MSGQRCPQCGFSHGWDGEHCTHCGYGKKIVLRQKAIVMEKGNLKEIASHINLQWAKGRWVQHLLQDDDGVLVVFQWEE